MTAFKKVDYSHTYNVTLKYFLKGVDYKHGDGAKFGIISDKVILVGIYS